MVKKLSIKCDFNGKPHPIDIYIGSPMADSHPVEFQSRWLADRGGVLPANIMKTLEEIFKISKQNKVSFEELCEFMVKEINSTNETIDAYKQCYESTLEDIKEE